MARWCTRAGARVSVLDTRSAPPQAAALQAQVPQARLLHGNFSADAVQGTDIRAVFMSPGLAPADTAPLVDAARSLGLWVGGELSLFAQALADLHTADERAAARRGGLFHLVRAAAGRVLLAQILQAILMVHQVEQEQHLALVVLL
jgi:UDP-N-acetylmuramoylalanine--D-glutamate ligase